MTKETNKTIEITVEEYESLKDDALLLQCIQNAGIDNWNGWDYAIEEYWKLKDQS